MELHLAQMEELIDQLSSIVVEKDLIRELVKNKLFEEYKRRTVLSTQDSESQGQQVHQ